MSKSIADQLIDAHLAEGDVVPISRGVRGRTQRPPGLSRRNELDRRSRLPCQKCGGPTAMRELHGGTEHTCKDGWCGADFYKPWS